MSELVALRRSPAKVDQRTLGELASAVNAEHALAEEASRSWLEHVMLAGEALFAAWSRVPGGEWATWVEENLTIGVSMAAVYLRAWYSRSAVPSDTSDWKQLRASYRGLPALPGKWRETARVSPEVKAEIKRRRAAGESWNAIAAALGSNGRTVRAWVDPEFYRASLAATRHRNAAYTARKKAAAAALEQKERAALAQKAGGDLSKAYANIRRALSHLEAARTASADADERENLRTAQSHLHRAEDSLIKALRGGGA